MAVQVSDWEKYNHLKDQLIQTGVFCPARENHRIIHTSGIPVDIIPFGNIADNHGNYSWEDESHFTMNVTGFDEAFAHSITAKFSENPELIIRLISPAGLAQVKMIAWNDERADRKKNAQDLYLLMTTYLDAGNRERIYNQTDSFSDSDQGFDYECAGARLLGRDIGKLGKPETIDRILRMLQCESDTTGQLRLITDMLNGYAGMSQFDVVLQLVQQMRTGLLEKTRK